MDNATAMAELHRMLASALEIADGLGLTMIAIHIDEANNLLATCQSTAAH